MCFTTYFASAFDGYLVADKYYIVMLFHSLWFANSYYHDNNTNNFMKEQKQQQHMRTFHRRFTLPSNARNCGLIIMILTRSNYIYSVRIQTRLHAVYRSHFTLFQVVDKWFTHFHPSLSIERGQHKLSTQPGKIISAIDFALSGIYNLLWRSKTFCNALMLERKQNEKYCPISIYGQL